MLLTPFGKRDNRGFRDERDHLSLPGPGNGSPFRIAERVPETFRPAIEDEKNVLVDVPTDTELIYRRPVVSTVNHSQLGERSPTDGHGLAFEFIVD